MENENKNTIVVKRFNPAKYLTFPLETFADRMKLFNARNVATSLSKLTADSIINVTDVMAEPGVRARSNKECQNTYIFTDDGLVYFTQSDGIGDTINKLVEALDGTFGNAPDNKVAIRIIEVPLSGDRTLKQIMVAE